jgi:glycogen debranching enzyme
MINLAEIPFSRFGSYLAFSLLPADAGRPGGLYLRSLRGPATGGRPMQEVLHIQLTQHGQPLESQPGATFSCLQLQAGDGGAELCLPEPHLARIHLHDVDMRLQMPAGMYDNLIAGRSGTWQLTVNSVVETKLLFTAYKGRIEVYAPWQAERSELICITLIPDEDGIGEFALQESTVNWPDQADWQPFDECVLKVQAELDEFTAKLPEVAPLYDAARRLAGYVLWSCCVAPQENLTQPSIYASKNGMIGIWSWDHAFHSLALAHGHPELAWAQIMAIFDHQDVSGALPDLVNDRLVSWSFCKPPVHGWILSRLAKAGTFLTEARLNEIYHPLEKWTEWWFEHRDHDHDGIPQCNHGNDSGWDNSTVFAKRPPVESPDITAFLVLQMDFLAQAAERLRRPAEAAAWKARSEALVQCLLEHFWREDHFVAVQVEGHAEFEAHSLLLYLPLLLGQRLPLRVRQSLIGHLKKPGEFLTPFGLATENLHSPEYRAKGYWRGPIWPAPTMILIDALQCCGEDEFANDLRQRFCDLVNRSGMAENFDAQTGQGYHDFHFSWTAGIFLTLAKEMLVSKT